MPGRPVAIVSNLLFEVQTCASETVNMDTRDVVIRRSRPCGAGRGHRREESRASALT